MSFSDLLKKADPAQLLSVVNILSHSGLTKQHASLAILALKIKRACAPGGNISKNIIEEIIKFETTLSDELKTTLDMLPKIYTTSLKNTRSQETLNHEFDYLSFAFRGMEQIDEKLFSELENVVQDSQKLLANKNGPGNEFLGWLTLPENNPGAIVEAANKIKSQADAVVFIGIGGSYLGAKAVISALVPDYANQIHKELAVPQIYFAGQHLSTSYLENLIKVLKDKRVCLVPISKSGTTTEPAVAFRILYDKVSKVSKSLNVVAITDAKKGALKQMASENNWDTFVIPDDVGGRYSVLTPVGLLPIAIAGVDIKKLVQGAKTCADLLQKESTVKNNPALAYALYRQAYHLMGKDLEILSCWSPYLTQITAWWKQLFGESEGKDGKGLYVSSCTYTTDLHSVGQLVQEGKRNFIETFLNVKDENKNLLVEETKDNLDGLNYLKGKSPDYINQKAYEGTKDAHEFGAVPTITITLNKLDPLCIGALLYWWEYACGLSAYTEGVNPFNQPGVEEYKKRMFKLLGKP